MLIYAIRNVQTGEWFHKKGRHAPKWKWTGLWQKARIWTHKQGPIQTLRANKLKQHEAEIVTFTVEEI